MRLGDPLAILALAAKSVECGVRAQHLDLDRPVRESW
jgi:hypothetical protein